MFYLKYIEDVYRYKLPNHNNLVSNLEWKKCKPIHVPLLFKEYTIYFELVFLLSMLYVCFNNLFWRKPRF